MHHIIMLYVYVFLIQMHIITYGTVCHFSLSFDRPDMLKNLQGIIQPAYKRTETFSNEMEGKKLIIVF